MNHAPSAAELQALSEGTVPATPTSAVDLKESGLSQRDALLAVTDDAVLWATPEGDAFATVQRDGHVEHHAVQSRLFKNWLLSEFSRRYRVNGRPATVGDNVVREVRAHLEARAFNDGVRHEAALRTVERDERIYVDLGTDDWSAVEVDGNGWRGVASPPVPMIRSRRTAALAVGADPDWEGWRQLLHRLELPDLILFTSWCLGALWPAGPYPLLVVGGEQGSGKSTLVRVAQRLVDPVSGDLLQPLGDDRDLIAAARHGRVLAFDNVSTVKADLADSICRLATGAEIGGRALFTDYDSASFRACRPIILNGIPDLCARGDLADRSFVVRLGPLQQRITERDFWREAEAVLPGAFAGLLNALSTGIANLEVTPTPAVRMADFARLVVAAEEALPWPAGGFLAAYATNQTRIVNTIVEGDTVAAKVVAFCQEHSGEWSGFVSELFDTLSERMSPEARRAAEWPANARWFSDRLTRAAPAMRGVGVDVATRHSNRGTRVEIRNLASLASQRHPIAA